MAGDIISLFLVIAGVVGTLIILVRVYLRKHPLPMDPPEGSPD